MEKVENTGYFCSDVNDQLTEKSNFTDAGIDIRSDENCIVKGRSSKLISTGLAIAVPTGHVGLLYSRSGLSAKYGIQVGAGVIDSDYRGEVKVLLYNHSDNNFPITKGDRISQLLTIPVVLSQYVKLEKDEFDFETERGDKGFGESGVK